MTTGRPPLRLGVIGMSPGNGHPYSWSAICNGYDAEAMRDCPFPAIPEYLGRQSFPRDALRGATVTHVATQDRAISQHIAAAARIPHVVDSADEMIGRVDGILLARDDADRHVEMSLPFLEAGLPIYIDKPIATRLRDLDALYGAQVFAGQIFSCSALRYSETLRLDPGARAALGPIGHVDAVSPKAWDTYAVHLIDPVLGNLGLYGQPCSVQAHAVSGVRVVSVQWSGVSATLTCLGALPSDIRLRYFGSHGMAERVFTDTFQSFKRALESFVEGVVTRTEITTRAELESVVSIIERGRGV